MGIIRTVLILAMPVAKSYLYPLQKYISNTMNLLVKLLITGLAVFISAYLLPGVKVDGMLSAIIVAAVLMLINAVVKPIMIILTLPVTVITLGLFLLVINAVCILLASKVVPGFTVDGFWWALLFSIILSIINSIFEGIAKRNE